MVDEIAVAHYRAFGFVVLREYFDAAPLSEEVDETLAHGVRRMDEHTSAEASINFRYVPTMCERTPVSLSLLDRFAEPAAALLGTLVLPVRAKAVQYRGGAGWHRDSTLDVASIGFACYLEPLTATTGALRVLPGSHHPSMAHAVDKVLAAGVTDLPGYAAETEPGDVVVFNEHLFHGSSGGDVRRQWRVDYVSQPTTEGEDELVRTYFSELYTVGWDGGYDSEAYPTYGAHWLGSGRPWLDELDRLGAHQRAQAEEAHARARS